MKILRIIASAKLAGGGPIEGIVRVGQAMRERGVEQEIATVDPSDAHFLQDFPAQVHALGEPLDSQPFPSLVQSKLHYSPRAVPWLREHIKAYDAVIVSGLWHFATFAARRALVGGATPYMVFPHGMLDPWFNETYPRKAALKRVLWRINEGPLLQNAAAVLFTSDEERLRAQTSFRPYRVKERVVAYGTAAGAPEPMATEAFRSGIPALGKRPYLLFLSRIHEKKGCDILIDAFKTVVERVPNLDLVIAGPDQVGLQAKLQKRAERLGIDHRIHWPGMLTGARKQGAFLDCEAFILPSHQENFGIVVAEALAAGRPVLTTDKVNIWRELDKDGAALIETDTYEGVGRLLDKFLALSPSAREAMSVNARACFRERFEIGKAADDLISALFEVTEKTNLNKPV